MSRAIAYRGMKGGNLAAAVPLPRAGGEVGAPGSALPSRSGAPGEGVLRAASAPHDNLPAVRHSRAADDEVTFLTVVGTSAAVHPGREPMSAADHAAGMGDR